MSFRTNSLITLAALVMTSACGDKDPTGDDSGTDDTGSSQMECEPGYVPLTGSAAFYTLDGPTVPHFFFKVQAMLPTGGQ